MRVLIHPHSATLWLSARDSASWADRPGSRWPCSMLSGRRLCAVFDSTGLVDVAIDGGRGEQDCPATEFNAITSDALGSKLPAGHPAWYAAVGQFREES